MIPSDLKTVKDLTKFAEDLMTLNVKLQEELKLAQDKLSHAESLLKFANSKLAVGSNEEELCKLEIKRLHDMAKLGPLEFAQVKTFEIYVKSLMLIKGKSAEEPKKAKKEQSLSQDQLIQLALQVTDESTEQ